MTRQEEIRAINELPIWRLPPEERPPVNGEEFNLLCARCFQLFSGKSGSSLDYSDYSTDFFLAFMSSYTAFVAREDNSSGFISYLLTAAGHRKRAFQQEEAGAGIVGYSFSRSDAAMLRKVMRYYDSISEKGLEPPELAEDAEMVQLLADRFGCRAGTLRDLLRRQRSVVRLDDTYILRDGSEARIGDTLPDRNPGVEEQVIPNTGMWLLERAADCVRLMDLEKRERWLKRYSIFFSSLLLGYLRCKEDKKAAEAEHLSRCGDLRPFAEDGLLWDVLILCAYLYFTVQGPFEPDRLEASALNPLVDTAFPPHADKTIAAFLNITPSAVSQRKAHWEELINLLEAQE